ncbi:MAG: prolyl oligopeptidase family serine peptidase [Micromonosporaceae bacterium]
MTESFPRQYARTRGFTLGAPRAFQISPDGSRVVFLRSASGTDRVNRLWVLDTTAGTERLAADPLTLGASGDEDVPPEEKARRERVRERAGGIVSYACDRDLRIAVFALSGHVYVAGLMSPEPSVRELPVRIPAIDPRPDPDGRRVAYVSAGALRVVDLGAPAHEDRAHEDRAIAVPENDQITYGLAEFAAAEEMHRLRGYWWAPDGSGLLVARVDESMVQRWQIADPANPDRKPNEIAYPVAGTANADVSLTIARLDGSHTPVEWDRLSYPYLVSARWEGSGTTTGTTTGTATAATGGAATADRGPLFVIQDRSQRQMRILTADPVTGACELAHAASDPAWLDIVPGVPAWTASGDLVWTADADGARRLFVAPPAALAAASPVTPPGLQVRGVLDVDGDTVLFSASQEPTQIHLWTYGPDGLAEVTSEPGVHGGRRAGGTTVIVSRSLDWHDARVEVMRDGRAVAAIVSRAQQPNLPTPQPEMFAAGKRQIRTAVLFPSWHQRGAGKLPVLLTPYGGPGHQEVYAARGAFGVDQWFAEQGFAVVVADGRGTGGRGPEWDRAVHGDLAGPPLEDQVEALHAAAERFGDLELRHVGIRGWSFGGYLSALAVLRRPDVFHAAVAGAPPTDMRLYDTHYTERYLGLPDENPDAYERCSLIAEAPRLTRPLMIIHGLADDNVVVAHTLRFSSALLAAGRPHSVLPLSGSTHMASQEEVAENLLLLQVDFLKRALGIGTHPAGAAEKDT